MQRFMSATGALVSIALVTTLVMAQPPGGPGRRGSGGGRGPGDRGGPSTTPLVEALDANGDRQISSDEIENAVAALKTLDKNNDGKLTLGELRPAGRPGRGRRAGRGPGGPGGPGAPDAPAFVERLLSFDESKDGTISKSELPERMHGILERHDANQDGVLDKTELAQVAAQFAQRRGGGPGAPRGGPGRGRPAGRGGPPSPEQFVEHAMTFDADQDGKLNRDEMRKLAEEFTRRAGPGRARGLGGPGRRPDAGGRPRRPARPNSD